MQDELFKTRYSKYGYGIDVRRTYKDLPCPRSGPGSPASR